jgi:hypothetical protein
LRFRGSTVVGWVACCDSASLWLGENFELISFLTLLLHVCVDHDDGLHLARHQERDIFILNHLAPFCPKVELRLEARLQSPLTPTPFVIVMVGSVALEYRTHISWSSPCTAVYPSCFIGSDHQLEVLASRYSNATPSSPAECLDLGDLLKLRLTPLGRTLRC